MEFNPGVTQALALPSQLGTGYLFQIVKDHSRFAQGRGDFGFTWPTNSRQQFLPKSNQSSPLVCGESITNRYSSAARFG